MREEVALKINLPESRVQVICTRYIIRTARERRRPAGGNSGRGARLRVPSANRKDGRTRRKVRARALPNEPPRPGVRGEKYGRPLFPPPERQPPYTQGRGSSLDPSSSSSSSVNTRPFALRPPSVRRARLARIIVATHTYPARAKNHGGGYLPPPLLKARCRRPPTNVGGFYFLSSLSAPRTRHNTWCIVYTCDNASPSVAKHTTQLISSDVS